MHPSYIVRALGGVLFLAGALIMAYNLWMTVNRAPQHDAEAEEALALQPAE
jgi:cytochrome c oxidase cbb3-type subunit 1